MKIENHGTICLVVPETELELDWLEEKTDGTWFCSKLAVEPRYVKDLLLEFYEEHNPEILRRVNR